MESKDAILALSALAQDSRLAIFRLLVRAGQAGLPAGEIARTLGIPANTLSAHLAVLARAGLVTGARAGRMVVYAPDLTGVRKLTAFLLADCCQGEAAVCSALLEEVLPSCC